ncbi:hypothetical protein EDD31_2168 [Bogoriella caseilytica]|uniref:Uncharacterized protein n=1 Tax=Bogoriella caseilytica TaxID=56055 RepID=A0A3N2BEV5_9MICO|nr:hypothetical protein EDD31_2168 [Bogoriella caseilytica]
MGADGSSYLRVRAGVDRAAVTTLRMLLVSRLVTLRRLLALVAVWCLVPVASRVGGVRVRPDGMTLDEPLEHLGAMALCLPGLVLLPLLAEPAPWLSWNASRPLAPVRTLRIAAVVGVGAVAGAIPLLLLPPGVPIAHFLALWMLLISLGVLIAVAVGSAYGALGSVLFVALMSVPGLVPYEANIVYNGSARPYLFGAAGLAVVLAVICYARWDEGTTRRQEFVAD